MLMSRLRIIYFRCHDNYLVTDIKQKILPLSEGVQDAAQDAKSVLITEERSHFLFEPSQTSNLPYTSLKLCEVFPGCEVLRD